MRVRCLIVALLSVVSSANAQEAPEPIYLYGANYVDVRAGKVLRNQIIAIEGDSLVVAPVTAKRTWAGRRIDARGQYVMPSLYDMHVHLLTGRMSPERALLLSLANGVTGIRDMGGYADSMLALRRRLARDPRLPRVVFAGPIVDGPKHRWSHPFALHATNASEAKAVVDSLRMLRVDFMKVYGAIPSAAYYALAEQARAAGLSFGGHIPSSVTTSAAAQAGQRTFEHATLDMYAECVPDASIRVPAILSAWVTGGYPARFRMMVDYRQARDEVNCADMLAHLKAARAYVVPTMVNELKDSANLRHPYLKYLPQDLQKACTETIAMIESGGHESRRSVYKSFQQDVKQLYQSGIQLMAGTDAPNACLVPGFSLHAELEQLVAAGLSPIDALRTATTIPRDFLAARNNDVVLLSGDPLKDIRNTQKISGVVVRRRLLGAAELQQMLKSLPHE
jgi:hypothetical protein